MLIRQAISKILNNQESKPKGIIIKGPEGTRKTFMAKVFIGEAQMPYMIISGGEVRSATDIKKIFSVARLKKSCIIFFDEFDAIYKNDNGEKVKLIAVVKGNGYGLDLVQYSKFLADNGVKMFAVATVEEALELRRGGIKEDILMMSSTAVKEDIQKMLDAAVLLLPSALPPSALPQSFLQILPDCTFRH